MALSNQTVSALAGITPGQLYQWHQRGLTVGQKSTAGWSYSAMDAVALVVMADLARAGSRTEQAARAAEAIANSGLNFGKLSASDAEPTWLLIVEGAPTVTKSLQALLAGKSITVIAARLHTTAKQIHAQIPATTTA